MVLTLGEIVCHVELGDVVGDLAVADIVPVQPDVEAGVDSFKKQEGTGGIRVFVLGGAQKQTHTNMHS